MNKSNKTEVVDVLVPPLFQKSGRTKPLQDTFRDGDWVGAYNVWILQKDPDPCIIYQIRSDKSVLAPNKVDVAAGGHYISGETQEDVAREVQEELGITYDVADLTRIGRRLFAAIDEKGREVRKVLDIFLVVDENVIEKSTLDPVEVAGILKLPLKDLETMWSNPSYSFLAQGKDSDNHPLSRTISQDSFVVNWDGYNRKMVRIAKRFLSGETDIEY